MRLLITLLVLSLLGASSASAQTLRRPVACDSCIANWYYFDHDSADGPVEDWNCLTSTYNGHRGSDFSLSGGLGAIDAGHDVVAVADGTVISTMDGFYDRCTSCPGRGAPQCGTDFGSGYGNHVRISYGSGQIIYAHLRRDSVRVGVGDTVRCGQVIGQIGSSGCSTGAHLHVEVRSSATAAYDPFQGPCSPTSPSRWTSQGPHRGMPAPTCDGMPPPPTCPAGWYDIWTCEGSTRRRCVSGEQMVEDCGPGSCESRPVGTADVCDADGDGYATDEGDCDDRNRDVRPGGTEVCGNGRDDDCSGGDMACPMMPDAATPPPMDDAAVTPATDASVPPTADAALPPGVDGGPRPDAASRVMDGGPSAGRDAGAPPAGRISAGCGCRVEPSRAPSAPLGLALLALAMIRSRSRRSARAR